MANEFEKDNEDALGSPTLRAKRLKRIRNMANLSREELCSHGDINLHTLISWENSRFGGLTLAGAKKALKRVAEEGVDCSLEWLLYGTGAEPSVNSQHNQFAIFLSESLTHNNTAQSETEIISKELAFFHSLHPNAVSHAVDDDAMQPIYRLGDYVAGIKKRNDEINKLIGLNCIVQTTDGKPCIRRLLPGTEPNKFTLINNQAVPDMTYNVELDFAAAIIWQRRPESKLVKE